MLRHVCPQQRENLRVQAGSAGSRLTNLTILCCSQRRYRCCHPPSRSASTEHACWPNQSPTGWLQCLLHSTHLFRGLKRHETCSQLGKSACWYDGFYASTLKTACREEGGGKQRMGMKGWYVSKGDTQFRLIQAVVLRGKQAGVVCTGGLVLC